MDCPGQGTRAEVSCVCVCVCVCVCKVVSSDLLPMCRHVSQKDRAGKRYRGAHSDVFVIADEDEELG